MATFDRRESVDPFAANGRPIRVYTIIRRPIFVTDLDVEKTIRYSIDAIRELI